MWRCLTFTGVCLLLVLSRVEANEKNTKNFWSLWNSNGEPGPESDTDSAYDYFSGTGAEDKDVTHTDDEDYDIEGSGDDEMEKMTEGGGKYQENNKDKDNRPEDDEDDDIIESGSGILPVEDVIVPETNNGVALAPKTTSTPLTPCQNLRKSALAVAQFVPECDLEGNFKRRQCIREPLQEMVCWCVDVAGREITGTKLKSPTLPGCDFGENLSTCIFQLVQYSQGLLGQYQPSCTLDGRYEPMQCRGDECWCVDENGNEMLGTIKNKPQRPDCTFVATTPKSVVKPKPDKTEQPTKAIYDISSNKPDNKVEVVIQPGNEIEPEVLEEEMNTANDAETLEPMEHNQGIMQQPGLLAAIIGGAVVGLLCMVLIVMFIVYRMRKKDEGSYPLDEQKYQNYTYSKAPDKEFYA